MSTVEEGSVAATPVPEQVGARSVGAQLRQAREAAGLTPEEVAQAIKFSPRQIEALEADAYAALPGATIVRGFVRNYARLLKLDADALLRDLDAVLPAAPAQVRPPDNMGSATPTRGVRELPSWAAALVVMLLAAIILVLWHFFGPKAPATTAMGAANPAAAGASVGDAAGNPSKPVHPPLAGAAAETTQRGLVFSFTERSWLEVVDGERRVLFSGENPAGGELALSGQPPFDIVIGNARGVVLRDGERVVDLMPHTRAEVARLRLE